MNWKHLIWIIPVILLIGYTYGYVKGIDNDLLTIPQVVNFCISKNMTFCSYDTNLNEFTCGIGGCTYQENKLIVYDNPSLEIDIVIEPN